MISIKHFYDLQKKLDQIIIDSNEISGEELEKLTDLKIIAFRVEVGELANELAAFKYWKKNHKLDLDKVKEELVDPIHFLFSIANDRKYTFVSHMHSEYSNFSINELVFFLFENPLKSAGQYLQCLEMLFSIGYKLGLTFEDIEKEYLKKYNKNIQRQKNNY